MKRLIYQVAVGKPSKLYATCIETVSLYCERHGIEHIVQTTPKLRIKPDIFTTGRSTESYSKHGGFLPIFEKENAFDLLDSYDQIAIVDADIFIREDAPNIFDDFGTDRAFGAVIEREMPITREYQNKIQNYSNMQYAGLHTPQVDFKPNRLGFEFANMGLILLNSKLFKPYLKGQTAKQFLNRIEFKPFVDGINAWKWSTDQTLLNYFIKKEKVSFKSLDFRWNGLYTVNTKITECYFVHFFLKDKLPNGGENVSELIGNI
jgi:hypothetical protein|tara:strand:+ start:1715 stop:2500 length:786 start_codon:yes stop_codon:yes gene_type:complete